MIMERKDHSQIFIKHTLIIIDQFAFLNMHFTTGFLHRIIDDWYETLNCGEFVKVFFFCLFLFLLLSKYALAPSITQYSCKSELCIAYVAQSFLISINDPPQPICTWSSKYRQVSNI